MNVLIIEDELLAQAKLESMLIAIDNSISIVGKVGSVKDATSWLTKFDPPDLAFVDIQLSDDHSFEIFRNVDIRCPVVFTTAYDKYILESFEFNSIDYLLKPITEEKLRRCLSKMKKLRIHFQKENLENLLAPSAKKLERVVVRKGTDYVTVNCEDIAYFFTEHRVVFLKDVMGKQYIVDKTLADLESLLQPETFFRLNRKFISHVNAIEKFKSDNGKIRIFLRPSVTEEIHISKETAPAFRKWIGKES